MDSSKIDIFFATNGGKFPPAQVDYMRQRLITLDDSKFALIQSLDYQDPTIVLIVSIVLGYLGVDRFLIGDIGYGVLKLLTGGGCGVLALIDWFLIMDRTKTKNFEKFISVT